MQYTSDYSENGAPGLRLCDCLGRLARVHLGADLHHLLKVWEGHGLELGVDDDVVDFDLEGRPSADQALDLRIGNRCRDGIDKFAIAPSVA